MSTEKFIEKIADIAVSDWAERQIMLPSVVIAQAILESASGKSELAVNANALFGIKKNGWAGKVYVKDATEQRTDGSLYVRPDTEWRAYDSWDESIIDHNNYIATREKAAGVLRYKDILGNTNYEDVCQLLKICGYATDLAYPEKLLKLINRYNLTQYDTIEESGNVAEIKAYSKAEDGNKKVSANFKVKEFACKDGSDPVFISQELVAVLQKIRTHFDKPVNITSAYRTPTYNKKVGGVNNSQHLYGRAADIKVTGVKPKDVATYAEKLLPNKGGIGTYDNFTHIDVRAVKSRWNG